jgi:hypothetical protein
MSRDLKLLQLFISDSCCFVHFESKPEDTQSIENMDLRYSKGLALVKIIGEESRCLEYSLVEERALDDSLIGLIYELVDQVVGLVNLA